MNDDFYNIALDCLDQQAHSPRQKNQTAMIHVKESGADLETKYTTYNEFYESANRLANALIDLGVKEGERIIINLSNSPEFAIAFFGVVKVGAIPVPTSPLLTAPELNFILKDSEAVGLITENTLLDAVLLPKIVIVKGEYKNAAYHPWDNLILNSSPLFKSKKTLSNTPAFWLYTSGTQGVPKGVIHAHRSVRSHDPRVYFWQDFKEGDIVFNTSSLNWSYALTSGFLDLWRHGGVTVIYEGKLIPETILKIIKDLKVTIFMSVPGVYRKLLVWLKQNHLKMETLKVCLSAGEKLSEEIRSSFKELTDLMIYEGLGMTEHSVYLFQRYGDPIVPGSCGRAFDEPRSKKISILKGDLTEATGGEIGFLASHRSCEGLMLGYHNRSKEEENVFQGDWFISGDLAHEDKEGNFFFWGRQDDTIKAGGYRISPLEIEKVLNSHLLVEEAAVIGEELEPGKTIIKAFIILKKGISYNAELQEDIMDYAALRLALYKRPRELVFVKEFPKTSNGKLRRKELYND